MTTLLTYNLNDLDKTQIANVNLKSIQKIMSSMDKSLIVKKCMGTSCGGTLYLIKSNDNTNNKKLICKKIPLSSSITKPYIQKYYKIMENVYNNSSLKEYINPIIDYKIKNDNLYVIFPYYSGYNLEQLKKKLLKLDNDNYKIIMKHLVKKLLNGLSILHNQGLYHQKLNENTIIINTTNKKKNVRIKFYDISINNSINNSINKKRTKKINKLNIPNFRVNTKLQNKDCIDCGNLLIDLISFKYIEDYNNSNNTSLLNKALDFLNIKRRKKTIEDIVDKDLVIYMNIINTKMINKQENVNKVLKEILLKEKYKD